jgi:tetratricopeptide (TPR) repeat protein
MNPSSLKSVLTGAVLIVIAAVMAFPVIEAAADFDKPKKPAVDCTQRKNRNNPACQPHRAGATQDEIYNAAYWMNRSGRFAEALDILKLAKTPDDPRILNETGYATRKLGNVRAALGYYRRALAVNPDYVFARAYMGEALLLQGDIEGANAQLSEIASRCGTSCPAYVHLSGHIAQHSAGSGQGG